MAEVLLSDVRKSFGRTDVIHGIDLHIRDRDSGRDLVDTIVRFGRVETQQLVHILRPLIQR